MTSSSRCLFSGICNLQWNTSEFPTTSAISLKSLVGKDLGTINLNWFEECGGASFTGASCGNLENSLLLTNIETALKGDTIKTVEATRSSTTFLTKDISDQNTSHSSLFGDSNFYSAAVLPSRSSDPAQIYVTENFVCDEKCATDTLFSYKTSPVAGNEKSVHTQGISPVSNNVLDSRQAVQQTAEVKDIHGGRCQQLIWSPVTQEEDSPQLRFPAFQTPQSYRKLSSTPRHLSHSLGIDPNDSDLKWSPSMETPTLPSQPNKLNNMVTPEQNSVACDAGDQACNSPHDTQDLIGNVSTCGSIFKHPSKDDCSPICKGHRKKQTLTKLDRLPKKKARKLFHGRIKDDYNDSTHHQNQTNEEDIHSVPKNVLCLPSELDAESCVPVLQQNISNALEFLFTAPSKSQEIRRGTSKQSVHISFPCEEFVLQALSYLGKRALFCDMRVIDMTKYLPGVWTTFADNNCSISASELNQRMGTHLSRLLPYVPPVQQKEIAAPLVSYFKSKISETVLKGTNEGHSLLSSLQDEKDSSVSELPNDSISCSQFDVTGSVVLNDTLGSNHCDRSTYEFHQPHCTAVGVTQSSESCLCVQYKWEFCSEDVECENLPTCVASSDSFSKHVDQNLNSVSHLPGCVSAFDRRGNFQLCSVQGHSANTPKALLPEKNTVPEQLGNSSLVICPEFENTVVKSMNVSDTGVVQMRTKNLRFNTHMSNLFSMHNSFSIDSGVISNMSNNGPSMLIDFPLLKCIDSNLVKHSTKIYHIGTASSVERQYSHEVPVEIFGENETTANIPLDLVATEPNCKSSEVQCNTQYVTDGIWTQSFDKMDSILAGISSQIYACSKPHGVTDSGTVLREIGVNQCTDPASFSSVALKGSERKGNKKVNLKFFVDSSLPYNRNYETNWPGNENISVQENIPSQFLKLSDSLNGLSWEACGKELQIKLAADSQNEIKMTDSENFLADSRFDAQTTADNTERPIETVRCSPVGLNFCAGTNANSYKLCPPDGGSNFGKVFDPDALTSNCGSFTNVSCEDGDVQHISASTDIKFDVVDKNIVGTGSKQKSVNTYLMDDSISDRANEIEMEGSLKKSIIPPDRNQAANSSLSNLPESCDPNFTVATGPDEFAPNHDCAKKRQMESTKTFWYNMDMTFHNDRYNLDFYSCLSQGDIDMGSIVVNTSNVGKCDDFKNVLCDNDDLKRNSEKFNEATPLPLEVTDIPAHETCFPDQTEKLRLKGDVASHAYHKDRDPNQLHQKKNTCHDVQCSVNSIFVDQNAEEAINPSKKTEVKGLLGKESKTVVPGVDDKLLGNSTCEEETTFENSDLCLQNAFAGFKTASEKSIRISNEAFHHAVSMFNQICDDLPVPQEASVGDRPETVNGINLETCKETTLVAKRKISKTDCGIESSVKLGSISDFAFQMTSGKKMKISEEALEIAKMEFDEISYEDVVSFTPLTSTHVYKVSDKGTEKCSCSSDHHNIQESDCKRSRESVENDSTSLPTVPQCCEKNTDVNSSKEEIESLTKEINTGTQLKMAHETSFRNKDNKPIILERESVRYQITDNLDKTETKSDKKDFDYETCFFLFNTTSEDVCFQKDRLLPSKHASDDKFCETETADGNTVPVGFKTASGHKIRISADALEIAKGKLADAGKRNVGNKCINTKFNTLCETDAQILPDTFDLAAQMLDDSFGSEITPTTACTVMQDNQKTEPLERVSSDRVKLSEEISTRMSDANSEKSCSSIQFQEPQVTSHKSFIPGFQTADGVVIHTSQQALNAAKKKMDEAWCNPKDKVTKKVSGKISETSFPGFQTAAGDVVKISAQALSAAKKRLEQACADLNVCSSEENAFNKTSYSELRTAVSDDTLKASDKKLQTAAGEEAKVSEKAVNVLKRKLKDADGESEFHRSKGTTEIPFCGFRTASGEQIKISENSLNAAKKRLISMCDDDSKLFCGNDGKICPPVNTSSACEVYPEKLRTSCKKVQIPERQILDCGNASNSEAPLNSTKRKLEEESVDSELSNPKKSSHARISEFRLQTTEASFEIYKPLISSHKTSFPGFQTAAGEEVKISEQALDAARRKLQACDSEFSDLNKVPSSDQMYKMVSKKDSAVSSHKTAFPLFQTAAGDEVKISEQALDAARRKLQACDSEFSDLNKVPSSDQMYKMVSKKDSAVSSHKTAFPLFQTAAGDEVKISKQALDAARRKLQACDSEFSDLNKVPSSDQMYKMVSKKDSAVSSHKTAFPLFQTAAGDEVKISEQALDAARRKLQACDSEFSDLNKVPSSDQMYKMVSKKDSAVSSHKTAFPLFQTAAGDEVKISKQALDAARRKLQACDSEFSDLNKVPSSDQMYKMVSKKDSAVSSHKTAFPLFQTAAGDEVKISKQALDAARRKLQACDSEFSDLNKVPSSDQMYKMVSKKDSAVSSHKTAFPLFQTAAGDEVKISEQALDAARRKLQACDSEFFDLNKVPSSDQMYKMVSKKDSAVSSYKTAFPLFQTAAGDEVKISKQALDAARRKLQACDSEFSDLNKVPSSDQMYKMVSKKDSAVSSHNTAFPLFQTAAGDEVKISEQALDAARRKLQACDSEFFDLNKVPSSDQMYKMVSKKDSAVSSHKTAFPLFQTAAGDEVKISEQALDAARRKLQSCDSEFSDLNKDPSSDQVYKMVSKMDSAVSSHKTAFPLFQTAAGDEVKISEQALDAARRKLQACDSEFSDLNKNPSSDQMYKTVSKKDSAISSHKTAFPLFQTAAGDEVKISEQALCAAKKKLKISADLEFYNQTEVNSADLGFQTVLSNEVKQSEEIFGHGDEKLVELLINSRISAPKPNSYKTSLPGFQTAAGDQVEISDEALNIAKQKLSECNAGSEFCSKVDFQGKGFFGFQTAGGEKVKVSEEALNAAKKMMEGLPVDKENFHCSKTVFSAFQTAGGDAVNISQKALSDTKKKLEQMSKLNFHDDEWIKSCNMASADISNEVPGEELSVVEKKILECKTLARPNCTSHNKNCISGNAMNAQKGEHVEVHINDQEFKREESHQIPRTVLGDLLTESLLSETNKINLPVTSHGGLYQENKEISLAKGNVCCKPFNGRDCISHLTKQERLIPDQRSKTQMTTYSGQKTERKSKSKGGVIPGKMWLLKSNRSKQSRMSYRDYVGNSLPGTYTSEELLSFGLKKSTLSVTSKNARDFVFCMNDHFISEASSHCKNVIVGDSASLILDDNFCAGKEIFYRAFLTIPGVSPALTSEGWFCNHYRWIILKLASLEVSFPKIFGGRCLLPEQLMLQMKWRYDCEIDNGKRSALKKILERDDLSSKTLVLFVSDMSYGESSQEASEDNKETNVSISLCDGWYEIPAQIDSAMCQLIKQNKVTVGQKLVVSGAELVGSSEACGPLEIPAGLKLKINTNSTRRARWDCKLGYFKDPRPFLVPLSSLLTDGGCMSCVKVVVVRVYPITFMEKYQDGSTTLRNERLENIASERHEKLKQSCLGKLTVDVEKSIQERNTSWRKRKSEKIPKSLSLLSSGREIYQVMEMANDPESIQSQLNPSQMRMLSQFMREQQEEKVNNFATEMKNAISEAQQQGKFPCDRVVTPLLKVFVKGILSSDKDQSGAMLNIWRPPENVYSLLTEGKVLKIYYLSVSRGKSFELQLNSNKATRYEEVVVSEEKLDFVYSPRQVLHLGNIKNITHSGTLQDVDVVGVVIHVTPEMSSHASGSCQLVYIADTKFNSLAIRFWSGITSLGFQDLLQVGRFISASNLKVDSYLDGSLPRATASVLTVFSVNPKAAYLQSALQNLKEKIRDVDSFVQRAKQHLQPKFDTPKQKLDKPCIEEYPMRNKELNSKSCYNSNISVKGSKLYNFQSPKPYPMYSPVTRPRNSVVPRRCRLVDRNAVGFKTESVDENILTANSSDSSPSMSSKTKERIAALGGYGCLPPMNALPVKVSPAATQAYKSPRINSPVISQQKLCPGPTEKSSLSSTDCKQNFGENKKCEK